MVGNDPKVDVPKKRCIRCGLEKPLTEEFWYIQRAREGHKVGWESHCRDCWKDINRLNKKRIRQK